MAPKPRARAWRIRIDATAYGGGCSVALTENTSKTPFDLPDKVYGVARYQIPMAGEFAWTTTDRSCLVTALPGMGTAAPLPFTQETDGDTDLISAPPDRLTAKIIENNGSDCTLRLFNSAGEELDIAQWTRGHGDATLHTFGAKAVYVSDDNCVIQLSAQS